MTDDLTPDEVMMIVQRCDTDPAFLAVRRVLRAAAAKAQMYAIDHPNMAADAEKKHVLYVLGDAAGSARLERLIEECKERTSV